MKKISLFLCISLIITHVSFGQSAKNQVSAGPEISIPAGTFADAYKIGFGGTAKGLLGVGKSGQVTLTLGYSSLKGKSKSSGGYSYAGQTINIIPYLGGYRQNLKSFYVEPQIGFATYTTKVTGFKFSETRLTYALGAGYSIHSLDLGLRFQSHEGISLVALRAAYVLDLKK